MGARPNHSAFLFLIWLMAAYLSVTLLLDWTGLSSRSYEIVKVTAELIPSIQPYAALSADADKATIELLLAWIFALVLPLVMLPALDWQWIGQNLARQGSLRTVFLLLATGMLLIALVWYPEPPSPSRRLIGRTILSLFRSDSAFVWGAVVVMFVGLGVTSLGVAFKHIHSVIVAKLG